LQEREKLLDTLRRLRDGNVGIGELDSSLRQVWKANARNEDTDSKSSQQKWKPSDPSEDADNH
jgi:hypothetical protein